MGAARGGASKGGRAWAGTDTFFPAGFRLRVSAGRTRPAATFRLGHGLVLVAVAALRLLEAGGGEEQPGARLSRARGHLRAAHRCVLRRAGERAGVAQRSRRQ